MVRLLYTADVPASHRALWRVDAKVGQPSPFPLTGALGANIERPRYSPDGLSWAK